MPEIKKLLKQGKGLTAKEHLTANFSSAIMESRRQSNNVFQVMRKNSQLRFLFKPEKLLSDKDLSTYCS
jgi:hypothetical protein